MGEMRRKGDGSGRKISSAPEKVSIKIVLVKTVVCSFRNSHIHFDC